MAGMKAFYDLVSKDKDVKIELGVETLKALKVLLTEKGLKDEARKVIEAVTMKVAKAHGFDLDAPEELSDDELNAVAGGECPDGMFAPGCGNCQHVEEEK